MNEQTRASFELRAEIFKALAHPTRLFFVHTLAQGPKCVQELAEMAGGDMSTISRHLSRLKRAGILADERKGTQVYYRLKTPCILKFFTCVEETIKGQVEEKKRLSRKIPSPRWKA